MFNKLRERLSQAIKKSSEDVKQQVTTVTDKIKTKKVSEKEFEKIFHEIEMSLLENNMALEVIDKIRDDLKEKLVDSSVQRNKLEEVIRQTLENTFREILGNEFDLFESVDKKPYVIAFVGVNGSGKTTTLAKIGYLFKEKNMSCVIAAADTFRAAAIQQLEEHAKKLNIKIIKHNYGADAAAVAYDAVKFAESKDKDIVLVDTAGRLHSNSNLMEEISKLKRVVNPDLTIFVGESITGNDCIEQAKTFNEQIGIDCIILTKADVDEKGGAAISVSYVTGKPVIFLGTGQEYKDLTRFDPEKIIESLF